MEAREHREIKLSRGTKNGRPRIVPVSSPEQILALEKFASLGNIRFGSIIPENTDLKTFTAYFYRTIRTVGMTKKDELNCHSFRHLNLQLLFTEVTKLVAPINSTSALNLKQNDPLLAYGYDIVTKAAGHADPSKATSYLGSKRIAKRGLAPYLSNLENSEKEKQNVQNT